MEWRYLGGLKYNEADKLTTNSDVGQFSRLKGGLRRREDGSVESWRNVSVFVSSSSATTLSASPLLTSAKYTLWTPCVFFNFPCLTDGCKHDIILLDRINVCKNNIGERRKNGENKFSISSLSHNDPPLLIV